MKPSVAIFAGLLFAMTTHAAETTTLKDAFKDGFLIGAALNPAQFTGSNQIEANIVKTQFNSISPENVLKWEKVHPSPDEYDFNLADKYVEFGVKNHMFIIGHTLIWHSQTPDWVFEDEAGDPVSREVLLQRMRDHIFSVVGRYKGKIKGWDVVNEAFQDNGSLRDSPWHRIIGDDFIKKAFEFAHEADPEAELYYNDYSLVKPAKRDAVVALVKQLQAQGIKITGVGIQGHYALDRPSLGQVDQTISTFESLGIKVMITELDINVLPSPEHSLSADVSERYQMRKGLNPYTNGLPDSVQQKLAQRYADLFGVFLKHRNSITRVTLWGVTDKDSWLNNYPVPGRTNYPLLFNRQGQPKPALDATLKAAELHRFKQAGN